MKITSNMIFEMQSALRGEATCSSVNGDKKKFNIGAVWYGDWHNRNSGRSFGTHNKPRHNACISKQYPKTRPWLILAPITSQRKTANVLKLRPGIISGGKFTASYVLISIQLRSTHADLLKNFTYKGILPSNYVQEIIKMAGAL